MASLDVLAASIRKYLRSEPLIGNNSLRTEKRSDGTKYLAGYFDVADEFADDVVANLRSIVRNAGYRMRITDRDEGDMTLEIPVYRAFYAVTKKKGDSISWETVKSIFKVKNEVDIETDAYLPDGTQLYMIDGEIVEEDEIKDLIAVGSLSEKEAQSYLLDLVAIVLADERDAKQLPKVVKKGGYEFEQVDMFEDTEYFDTENILFTVTE